MISYGTNWTKEMKHKLNDQDKSTNMQIEYLQNKLDNPLFTKEYYDVSIKQLQRRNELKIFRPYDKTKTWNV